MGEARMTGEQFDKRFEELEDRIYELECDKNRLENEVEDLKSLCSRLEDKITDIGWRPCKYD
jgi:predicted  nucleic acid-binding Zn-ribbon protein